MEDETTRSDRVDALGFAFHIRTHEFALSLPRSITFSALPIIFVGVFRDPRSVLAQHTRDVSCVRSGEGCSATVAKSLNGERLVDVPDLAPGPRAHTRFANFAAVAEQLSPLNAASATSADTRAPNTGQDRAAICFGNGALP